MGKTVDLEIVELNRILDIHGEIIRRGNTLYILDPVMGMVPWLSYDGKDETKVEETTNGQNS